MSQAFRLLQSLARPWPGCTSRPRSPRVVWQRSSPSIAWSTTSIRYRFSAAACLAIGVGLLGLSSLAIADDFWIGDPIVVDSGIRTYDPYGFRTRLDLCSSGGQLSATWAESEGSASRNTQVLHLNADGEGDGSFHYVRADENARILQAWPIESGEYVVLETHDGGDLFLVRRRPLGDEPLTSVSLDTEPIDTARVWMECSDDGWFVVWASATGEVKLAEISASEWESSDTELLGAHEGGLDVEFQHGQDGGVAAWANDDGISYVLFRPDGSREGNVRRVQNVSVGRGFSAARMSDNVCFVLGEVHNQRYIEILSVDSWSGTPRNLQQVEFYLSDESRIASGPEGALVVSDLGFCFPIDLWGDRTTDDFATVAYNLMPGEYERSFDAVWTGSKYLVVFSELLIEVASVGSEEAAASHAGATPPESPLARYCYVQNDVTGRTVTQEGELGPELTPNAGFLPALSAPWFVGTDLYVLLEDDTSHDGTVLTVDGHGESSPVHSIRGPGFGCDKSIRTGGSSADGSNLVLVHWSETYNDWYDWYDEHTSLIRVLDDGTHTARGMPHVGSYWDTELVGGSAWIVSNYTADSLATRFWSETNATPRELEPAGTGNVQVVRIGGSPYAIWTNGQEIYGRFLPQTGTGSFTGTLLHTTTGTGIFLGAAGGSALGAIVTFQYTVAPGDRETQVLALGQDGLPVAEPAVLSETGVSPTDALWIGTRYLVVWGGPDHTLLAARVSSRGIVHDPGGILIDDEVTSAPKLAFDGEGQIAVATGTRIRFLGDVTPIVATGPFPRNVDAGIELSWRLGEGEVLQADIERADGGKWADGGGSTASRPDGGLPGGDLAGGSLSGGTGLGAEFVTVASLAGSTLPDSWVDTGTVVGQSYVYQLRLILPGGEEQVLGPVEATRAAIATTTNDFQLLPNPSRGTLALRVAGGESFDRLEIIDVTGRIRARVSGESVSAMASVSVGRGADGRLTDDHAADGRAAGRAADGTDADGRAVDGRAADERVAAGYAAAGYAADAGTANEWNLSPHISGLPSGTYWVRLSRNGTTESRRVQILR